MRKIVIAPKALHKSLFNIYRKEDIFNDPKFYTREQLLAERLIQIGEDGLIELIKIFKDYSLAKRFLKDITKLKEDYSGNNPNIKELSAIKKQLPDSLFIRNEYLDHELETSDIDIYMYSKNDRIIQYALNGKSYNYISNQKPLSIEYNHFINSSDELFYTFNKIADLIASGVPAKNIGVYGVSESDTLTVNRLKEYFGININSQSDKLIDTSIGRYLINHFFEDGFSLDNYQEDENYKAVKEIQELYKIEGLSIIEQQRVYSNVLKFKSCNKTIFVDAINLLREPIVKEGDYLFILNFVQGSFPDSIKDSGILDDKDNIELGLPSLAELNEDNEQLYRNYLVQPAHLFISYSDRNNQGNLYLSPLGNKDDFKHPELNKIYSLKEARVQSTIHHDLYKDYLFDSKLFSDYKKILPELEYRTYDNSWKGIVSLKKNKVLLSATSLKTFYQCGFRYYLDKVLKIEPFEDTFYMILGNISHGILEHLDDPGFDFDICFEQELNKYIAKLDEREKYLLTSKKEYIREGVNFILNQEKSVQNPIIFREKTDSYTHKEESKYVINVNENFQVEGRIDKYIVFGDEQQYISIVDYKSGREEFNEDLARFGLSMQLPIYAWLLKESEQSKARNINEKEIAGIYIQHTYNKDGYKYTTDNPKYYDNLKLRGIFLDSVEMMEQFDTTLNPLIGNYSSTYVSGCSLKKPKKETDPIVFAGKSKKYKNKEWFDEMIAIAKEKSSEAYKQIINNEFKINPKIINGKNYSCDYCPYQDICFKGLKDFEFVSNGDEDNG